MGKGDMIRAALRTILANMDNSEPSMGKGDIICAALHTILANRDNSEPSRYVQEMNIE